MKQLLTYACFCITSVAFAQPTAGGETAQDIRALEARRFESMTKSDTIALRSLLADDLVYIHSNGKTESKNAFIRSIASGQTIYKSVQTEGLSVRVYGQTAIVTGLARVHVLMDGNDLNLRLRYTDAYVKRQDRWQLVTWQSTRLPEP